MSTTIDVRAESSNNVNNNVVAERKADVPPAESSNNVAVAERKVVLLETRSSRPKGMKKGIAIICFALRILAVVASLGAAGTMATNDKTVPYLFTQLFHFQPSYDSLPTFQFFVLAMAIVGGYLFLSLVVSFITVMHPHALAGRLLLIILDTVCLILATCGAAAATTTVYLVDNSDQGSNWFTFCNEFGDFCKEISIAVVASFVAVVLLFLLIVIAAPALPNH